MTYAHILDEFIFDIELHVPIAKTASARRVADGAAIKPATLWNGDAFPGYIFLKIDNDHHRKTDPVDSMPDIRLKK